MFSGAAKVMNAMDSGNNCRPVNRDEFRSTDPLSMFLLPTEVPYIVLRSHLITHVFTDVAYIQFRSDNSNGAKKQVRRLDYAKYDISAVFFEMAGGGMDFDCTLSFRVDNAVVQIDIVADQQPFAAKIYACLVALCRQQQKNLRYLELAKHLPSLNVTVPANAKIEEIGPAIYGSWIHYCVSSYDPENYAIIFQQYFA